MVRKISSTNRSLYDYESFESIKAELDPSTFSILDSAVDRHAPGNSKETFLGAYSAEDPTIPTFDEDDYMIKFALYSHETISEGPYFDYKINSDGFRTEHLSKLNGENLNIVFSGCSFTHGAGLPSENAWPSKLIEKISSVSDKPVQSYNLALGGSGVFQTIKNLRVYIDKYGIPDYIFVLFPGFERTIKYQDQNGTKNFLKVTTTPPHSDGYKNNKAVRHFMDSYVIEESILFATEQINMMEFVCNRLGINLIWSTWADDYKRVCKETSFKNYLDVTSRERYKALENTHEESYWELARDLNHPGSGYHTVLADEFFNAFSLTYKKGDAENV